MRIFFFFPFIFLKPLPLTISGFFLTPPQEILSKENIIAPPAHKYNMSSHPGPYQSLVTGILSSIGNQHSKSVTTCTNEMVRFQDVTL